MLTNRSAPISKWVPRMDLAEAFPRTKRAAARARLARIATGAYGTRTTTIFRNASTAARVRHEPRERSTWRSVRGSPSRLQRGIASRRSSKGLAPVRPAPTPPSPTGTASLPRQLATRDAQKLVSFTARRRSKLARCTRRRPPLAAVCMKCRSVSACARMAKLGRGRPGLAPSPLQPALRDVSIRPTRMVLWKRTFGSCMTKHVLSGTASRRRKAAPVRAPRGNTRAGAPGAATSRRKRVLEGVGLIVTTSWRRRDARCSFHQRRTALARVSSRHGLADVRRGISETGADGPALTRKRIAYQDASLRPLSRVGPRRMSALDSPTMTRRANARAKCSPGRAHATKESGPTGALGQAPSCTFIAGMVAAPPTRTPTPKRTLARSTAKTTQSVHADRRCRGRAALASTAIGGHGLPGPVRTVTLLAPQGARRRWQSRAPPTRIPARCTKKTTRRALARTNSNRGRVLAPAETGARSARGTAVSALPNAPLAVRVRTRGVAPHRLEVGPCTNARKRSASARRRTNRNRACAPEANGARGEAGPATTERHRAPRAARTQMVRRVAR
mmetsp:Transcript_9938/g.32569  ORF Transcript_9938/g.32569 Transcript_9938/m.32569 type:complete len:561 (+) Transcript_9938:196-1878(+)